MPNLNFAEALLYMIKGKLIILNKISSQILTNFQILKYQRKCGFAEA